MKLEHLRGELLEAVAEFDDNLWKNISKIENSLTEREILDALREATIAGKVVPMMCGSAFKNKGVQAMLDMVMEILPSPLDIEAIYGTNPYNGGRNLDNHPLMNLLAHWLLKLLRIHLLVDYVLLELTLVN